MNTVNAIKICQADIITILTGAGAINGLSATTAQKGDDTKILYWESDLKGALEAKRPLYLVWYLISVDPLNNAEDTIKNRLGYITLDLFTRHPAGHKKVVDLIALLEAEAVENGWSFEFKGPSYYETETNITKMQFDLLKRL